MKGEVIYMSFNTESKSFKKYTVIILVLAIIIIAFVPILISKINENGKNQQADTLQNKDSTNINETDKFNAKQEAEAFVEHLINKEYEKAASNFNDEVAKVLNKDTLKDAWEKTIATVGEYKGQYDIKEQEKDSMHIVEVISEFEKSGVISRVVFDSSGKVSGLWFNYTAIEDKNEGNENSKNSENEASNLNEHKVTIGEGEWALPGLLTIPQGEGPFPAVVLVHGSGPNDMDETIGPNKPFKDIAEGLVQKGIAVLRYDKRTFAHGAKMQNVTDITVKEETIDDALAAIALLKADKRIDKDKVFILGHSLGGMLAPRMAYEASAIPDRSVAGIMIMAGSPRNLEDGFSTLQSKK